MRFSSQRLHVVGGGTVGCVIAARVSADPHVSVLVFEPASGAPLPEMTAPQAWPLLFAGPADWADASRDAVTDDLLRAGTKVGLIVGYPYCMAPIAAKR